MNRNIWKDAIMGVVIGDALGLPVQFKSREELKENPVTEMMGYGTFNMPKGAWSDDSSMTLATLDSIRACKEINYDDIMQRFVGWEINGEYTPTGKAYDQGCTCVEAIYNYIEYQDYKTCGKTGEWANGNGALMRIMPVCLYAYFEHKKGIISIDEAITIIHQTASLTHHHLRSNIACGSYFFMIKAIIDEEGTLIEKLQKGMDDAKAYYTSNIANLTEWIRYSRFVDLSKFSKEEEENIKSSGYVVDSLEAAVWSLVTTSTFKDALLKAVNLGRDTDTIAAIAGGLGGIFYGYNSMPTEWKKAVIMREEIVALCDLIR